jgi:adenine phosphoribosyltransferase
MNAPTPPSPPEAQPLDLDQIRAHIRDIPDFPQPGIVFRDITPLLADAAAFRAVIDIMASPYRNKVDVIVAVESRGFIFGAPLAYDLGTGLVPVRKRGRLPFATIHEEYALEYGSNVLEIHEDAVHAGQRVLLVDDLLATGGTVRAAANLVRRLGGELVGACFLAELSGLNGRAALNGLPVTSLVVY